MPYSTLLDGLSVSGKLIWCSIQMGVRIFLWSMLFFKYARGPAGGYCQPLPPSSCRAAS